MHVGGKFAVVYRRRRRAEGARVPVRCDDGGRGARTNRRHAFAATALLRGGGVFLRHRKQSYVPPTPPQDNGRERSDNACRCLCVRRGKPFNPFLFVLVSCARNRFRILSFLRRVRQGTTVNRTRNSFFPRSSSVFEKKKSPEIGKKSVYAKRIQYAQFENIYLLFLFFTGRHQN